MAVQKLYYDAIRLPNGKIQSVSNSSYGGNGYLVHERANGKCEFCGATEKLCITRMNGYSTELKDLAVLCKSCSTKTKVDFDFKNKVKARILL